MVFADLTRLVREGGHTRSTDLVDKVNFAVTPAVFAFFATFATLRSYLGDPIDCWTDHQFSAQWNSYVDSLCWATNTYYLPWTAEPEEGKENGMDEEVTYYQWTALILIGQGCCFYLLSVCWRFIISHQINLEAILKVASLKNVSVDPDERHTLLQKKLSKHFYIYISRNGSSTFLSMTYIAVKVASVSLPLAQLVFLSTLFGRGYRFYGIHIMQEAFGFSLIEAEDPVRFPVVAWCDFQRRVPGNVQQFTVHCVLTANIFNRAIFILVWFWLAFISIASSINTILWIYRLFGPFSRRRFLRDLLQFAKELKELDKEQKKEKRHKMNEFSKYLGNDVTLVLWLISCNLSNLVACELVSDIYHLFDKPLPSKVIPPANSVPPTPGFVPPFGRFSSYPNMATQVVERSEPQPTHFESSEQFEREDKPSPVKRPADEEYPKDKARLKVPKQTQRKLGRRGTLTKKMKTVIDRYG